MYKKGLCSISFRNHAPKDIIVAAKDAGLSYIEWGSDVHAPYDDLVKLGEIVRLQDMYGIRCSSYGTYFRLGRAGIDELEKYISAAKILGTDILRLWCGERKREDMSDAENRLLLSEAERAADIACKNGVTLCMECHINSYTETLTGTLELMDRVGSEHFGMYWQPNQLVSVEDNLRYAKAVSGFVRNIHVFNWLGSERYSLCDGVDIWKRYLDCFDGDKTLLLEFMPDDRIESLISEAGALSRILEGRESSTANHGTFSRLTN